MYEITRLCVFSLRFQQVIVLFLPVWRCKDIPLTFLSIAMVISRQTVQLHDSLWCMLNQTQSWSLLPPHSASPWSPYPFIDCAITQERFFCKWVLTQKFQTSLYRMANLTEIRLIQDLTNLCSFLIESYCEVAERHLTYLVLHSYGDSCCESEILRFSLLHGESDCVSLNLAKM